MFSLRSLPFRAPIRHLYRRAFPERMAKMLHPDVDGTNGPA